MLELCRLHFAFLGKASQQTYLRNVETGKRITSRQVIQDECLAAIRGIEEHVRAADAVDAFAEGRKDVA